MTTFANLDEFSDTLNETFAPIVASIGAKLYTSIVAKTNLPDKLVASVIFSPLKKDITDEQTIIRTAEKFIAKA